MGIIRNPVMPRFIPEKYEKTRFHAACYWILTQEHKRTGQWINFQRFKELAEPRDKMCHEHVFDWVKNELQLDRVLNPSNVSSDSSAPLTQVSGLPRPHEKFIKDGASNLGDAIVDGLKHAQNKINRQGELVGPKREPVSQLRREQAQNWIWANPKEGWGAFHHLFPEPDFDSSWFAKTRAEGTLITKAEEPAEAPENRLKFSDITFDPRMKEETRRVVKYLFGLTNDRLEGMTSKQYIEKTGDKKIKDSEFQSARRFIRTLRAGESRRITTPAPAPTRPAPVAATAAPKPPAPVAAPAPAAPVTRSRKAAQEPHNPYAGRTATVELARIPLEAYKTCEPKVLKQLVIEVLKQMGQDVQVKMMSDPPEMEISAQVQL